MEPYKKSKFRHLIYALVCALSLSVAAACDKKDYEAGYTDLGDIQLEQYQWAIRATEPHAGGPGENSFLILVKDSGEYAITEIGYLDGGNVSWSESGLFFSDQSTDYWLFDDAPPQTTPIEKSFLENGMVVLSDGETRVSTYNGGFTETGYDGQIVISSPGKSTIYHIDSGAFYALTTACGDDAFGLTNDLDLQLSEGENVMTLDRFVRDGKVDMDYVRRQPAPFQIPDYNSPDAPCKDGVITHISIHGNSPGFTDPVREPDFSHLKSFVFEDPSGAGLLSLATIDSWDSSTGEYTAVPLVDEAGNRLDVVSYQLYTAEYDHNSLTDDGFLIWLNGDGRLFKTDVETGVTQTLNDNVYSVLEGSHERTSHVSFGTDQVSILVADYYDFLRKPAIVIYDLESGSHVRTIDLSRLEKDLPPGGMLGEIAHRPAS